MNLLITLGDSWTYGSGCYPQEILGKLSKRKISKEDAYDQSISSFTKNCWPQQLANILNYDLINFGYGGDSSSGQVKNLFDNISDDLCKDYKNVFVLFLLTDGARPSFYVDGKIRSYHQNEKLYQVINKLSKRDVNDTILENNFYIKCVEKFCKSNGYHFLFANSWNIQNSLINHKSNIHYYLDKDVLVDYIPSDLFSFCGHPNTEGYTIIAKKFQEVIKSNYIGKTK